MEARWRLGFWASGPPNWLWSWVFGRCAGAGWFWFCVCGGSCAGQPPDLVCGHGLLHPGLQRSGTLSERKLSFGPFLGGGYDRQTGQP